MKHTPLMQELWRALKAKGIAPHLAAEDRPPIRPNDRTILSVQPLCQSGQINGKTMNLGPSQTPEKVYGVPMALLANGLPHGQQFKIGCKTCERWS